MSTTNPLYESTLEAAREYVAFGWPVFPLRPRSKKPLIKWEPFQSRLPSDEELIEWFDGTKNGVAIVTGNFANLLVVDDDGHGNTSDTLSVQTRDGRKHLYFQNVEGVRNGVKINGLDYDIRGQGGYVVAPPSIHPDTGTAYAWDNAPSPGEVSDIPEDWLPKESKSPVTRERPSALDGIGEIYEGRRNSHLTSVAGKLRRDGSSEDQILRAIEMENADTCDPQLGIDELKQIAKSVSRYEPWTLKRTEHGLAHRFLKKHAGQFLFHAGAGNTGMWFWYDGTRWTRDTKNRVELSVNNVITGDLLREVANEPDSGEKAQLLKWASASQKAKTIGDVLKISRSHETVAVDDNDLDRENTNLLLNVRNGTIDLHTMELMSHDPSDRITMLSPVWYDPDATSPRWKQFLVEVFKDEELIAFIQRLFGYVVQGGQQEHILPVLWGNGSNGKSTFIETLSKVFGDYKVELPTRIIMRRKMEEAYTGDLLRMRHRRLVTVNESDEGGFIQENVAKGLTGGDPIVARGHYKESEEFLPTHTLFLRSNHKPRVAGVDEGIWRRLLLIPFEQQFSGAGKDITLQAQLSSELPGILNWVLDGVQLYAGRLNPPKIVTEATDDWREDSDEVGQFLTMATYPEGEPPSSGSDVSKRELFKAYAYWKGPRGQIAERIFNDRLRVGHHLEAKRTKAGLIWKGVYLKPEMAPPWEGQ